MFRTKKTERYICLSVIEEKEINKKVLNFGLMLYEQGKFNSDKAYLAQYEIDNYRQHLVNEVLHSKRKDVINHELENQRGYYV